MEAATLISSPSLKALAPSLPPQRSVRDIPKREKVPLIPFIRRIPHTEHIREDVRLPLAIWGKLAEELFDIGEGGVGMRLGREFRGLCRRGVVSSTDAKVVRNAANECQLQGDVHGDAVCRSETGLLRKGYELGCGIPQGGGGSMIRLP